MTLSFDAFVAERLPAVLRFSGVLTGDRHLAEDVVQEVLLKAHKRWDDIATKDRPEAYVRRMVVNEYVSWLRKWARILPSGNMRDIDERHAADHANQQADRSDLADRLRRLPARQRTVIVLRFYQGLSDAEIADVLGCAPATVRGYASRALGALRVDIGHDDFNQRAIAGGEDFR